MKFLLPLINITIAAGVFFFFTDRVINQELKEEPIERIEESRGGIKALIRRRDDLMAAIAAAADLRQRSEKLKEDYYRLDEDKIERLNILLPDQLDNIRTIVDLNAIAVKNGLKFKNVKVATETNTSNRSGNNAETAAISSGEPKLGTLSLSFTVTGTYDAYQRFLKDLSRSLRIADVSSTSFAVGEKGEYDFNMEVKTYWFK